MAETWWEYVQRITRRAQQKDIAEATGIEQSSISRWKLGKNTPKAEAVVAVARAYGRAPVEALVAAGYLEVDEVGGVVETGQSVHDLSTEELLEELRHRIPKNSGLRVNPDAPTI